MAHADRAHAKLSPSKADMWAQCTASIGLIEKINPPDSRSAAADEGTAAHELLERSLKFEKHPSMFTGQIFNKTWKATREMVDAVAVAYDLAMSLKLAGWKVFSEMKLHISSTGDTGTVDMAFVKGKRIKIADYKHGRGVGVPAKENRQMRLYAIGFIEKMKIAPTDIELIIIQPRYRIEPDRWTDTYGDLWLFRDEISNIRDNIEAGKTKFTPGPKQCQWCPVKQHCSAYSKSALESVGLDFNDVSTAKQGTSKDGKSCATKTVLTDEELVVIAQNVDYIDGWLRSIRERMFNQALNGKLPGFKVVRGDANRKWKDEEKIINAFRKLKFDVDDFMPRNLVGLTAARELFSDKKKYEEFLTKNTIRPEGKPVLATSDDPRPAINPGDDFADIKE